MKSINLKQIVLVTLIAATTFISSCKDKEADNIIPSSSKITEYQAGEDFMRFEYGTDNKLKRLTANLETATNGETENYDLVYHTNGQIKEVNISGNRKMVPVYTNGQITRADIFEDNVKTGFTEYVFQSGNLKTVEVKMLAANNQPQTIIKMVYSYDSKNNISKAETFMSLFGVGELAYAGKTEFTYDSKNNPLFAHKELFNLLWMPTSASNVLTEKFYAPDGALDEDASYVYQYYSNQLPKSATALIKIPGEPNKTETIEYTYKK